MRRTPIVATALRAAAAPLSLLAALAAGAPAACAAPLAVTPGPGVRVQPFGIYGAARHAVVAVTAPATFRADVTVPPNGRLVSAVAAPDRIWTTAVAATAAPLTFRVRFESAGESVTLYERTIDIAAKAAERRWFDFGRDLSALAGRQGTLTFETVPAAGAGAAAGTLALWAPPEIASCSDAAPSVLLVTIDALRADRLSATGYARPTTPFLDRFAAAATRFDAAFAAGPKTIPSIPQILTGTYFFRHRASAGLTDFLGPAHTELSRAVVNNPYVSDWLAGEEPGFATVVSGELDARAITGEALRFLSAAGRCRSVLYLHYLDTHTPYQAPPRYARKFVDPHAATTIGLTFADVTGTWQSRYGAADRRRIVDLYDGAVAWTDRQLGRLFRGLARRGLSDRTVIVVTADHGEELWEHGRFFHGQSLYDELLHVPLVVRLPAAGHGRVVTGPVSTIDIVPTIAEAAGLPAPAGDGVSLVPLASGSAADPAPVAAGAATAAHTRTLFATVSNADPRSPPRQAVRTATMKLVRNVADGLVEVYDLTQDAREQRSLGPGAPAAADLLAALDAIRLRLAGRGHQLRLRASADRPVAYVVTLAGEPPVPIVEPDRLTLERGDRVRAGERSSVLTVSGTLEPGDEDQVRMDILAAAGKLKVSITLDGMPAPAGTLRLGADHTPGGTVVDLADPALAGEPSGSAKPAAGAPPVVAELWRGAAADAGPARGLDPAARERLRQLGYVE